MQHERPGPVELGADIFRACFQDHGVVIAQVVEEIGIGGAQREHDRVTVTRCDALNAAEQVGGWAFSAQAVERPDDVLCGER